MIQMKKILFCTDFSPCAETAFVYAYSLAFTFGAELHILHVCSHEAEYRDGAEYEKKLKEKLNSYVKTRLEKYSDSHALSHLHMQTYLLYGSRPSREISRFVDRNEIDLVVIGSSGSSTLKRLIHGSTAHRVIKMVKVPVMSVHEEGKTRFSINDPSTYLKFDKILVGTDFSDCSISALEFALFIGKRYNARIIVFHILEEIFPVGFDVGMVVPFPDLHEGRMKSAEANLEEILKKLDTSGCTITKEITSGVPSIELLDKAAAENVSLIIMGSFGKDAMEEWFIGSVTDKVVRNATCPVISMPCVKK